MEFLTIDVVRGAPRPIEVRAEPDSGMPTLHGHFARFNEWYEINSIWEGQFVERVAPGAFAASFAAHWDPTNPHRTKVQFGHGMDPAVGGRLLGQLTELEEDEVGGRYAAPLFDTTYNRDLVPGLEAGEYGASFRFRVLAESWDDEPGVSAHNPKGRPERTIDRATVLEVGPVAFGASPTATAGLRSLTDDYYEVLAEVDEPAFAVACRSAGRPVPAIGDGPVPRPAPIRARARAAGADRDLKALPDVVLERGLDLGPFTARRRGQQIVEARTHAPDWAVTHLDRGVALEAYLAVYDDPDDVGGRAGWSEIWTPGAAKRSVARNPDVRVAVTGSAGPPIARTLAGTFELTSDDYGLHGRMILDPADPRAADVIGAVQRGDRVDVQVGFDVTRQRWNDEHTVRHVDEIYLHDVAVDVHTSGRAAAAVDELASRSLIEPDGDHMGLDLALAIRARWAS